MTKSRTFLLLDLMKNCTMTTGSTWGQIAILKKRGFSLDPVRSISRLWMSWTGPYTRSIKLTLLTGKAIVLFSMEINIQVSTLNPITQVQSSINIIIAISTRKIKKTKKKVQTLKSTPWVIFTGENELNKWKNSVKESTKWSRCIGSMKTMKLYIRAKNPIFDRIIFC